MLGIVLLGVDGSFPNGARASRSALFAGACVVTALGVACGGSTHARRANDAVGCRESKADARYAGAIKAARPLARRLNGGLRAPGLSLAVAAKGSIVWAVNCGYADIERRRLVGDHTRFRIGSVSK